MNKKIRVCLVKDADYMNGGVEKFIELLVRGLDRSKYEFTVLVTKRMISEHAINNLSGHANIVELKENSKNKIEKLLKLPLLLRKFYFHFSRNQYEIVHINTGVKLTQTMASWAAKKAGVPFIIAHTHGTGVNNFKNKLYDLIFRATLRKCPDIYVGCSKAALDFTFHFNTDKKKILLYNGVKPSEFAFCLTKREQLRQKFGFTYSNLVVGHVGNYTKNKVKNQEFLIDVFQKLKSINNNAKLILVGNGITLQQCKLQVKHHNLERDVLFLGDRNDVADLLSVMDVFCFPSLFEGLGIVLLEAQANGLPILTSDKVPLESKATPCFYQMSLQESHFVWAQKLNEMARRVTHEYRNSGVESISQAGFCEEKMVKGIDRIYQEVWNRVC